MREIVRNRCRRVERCLPCGHIDLASSSNAFAQAKQAPKQAPAPAAKQQAAPPPQPPPMKQMALTEKQIEGVLAASKEVDAITDKIPENANPIRRWTRSSTRSQRRTALRLREYNDRDRQHQHGDGRVRSGDQSNMSAPKPC